MLIILIDKVVQKLNPNTQINYFFSVVYTIYKVENKMQFLTHILD
jgi:hypothetical protein